MRVPLVNLTPHEVTIFDANDRILVRCPAATKPVRVAVDRCEIGRIEGIPVVSEDYGRALLPDPARGIWYIVSATVALAHPERRDLLVPTDLVRSSDGTILGCKALGRRNGT
ncbi:hypothetical protein [Nocardiopsis trehalosi]|jgi:hypothetical protein|uniref:hypothetical protein n=1 Tax=Nocardiopsis trehalosi TaxID=109329 RepID=UPI00082B76E6|nr:hypothetical protein [Nocardiopsis trehalosi]